MIYEETGLQNYITDSVCLKPNFNSAKQMTRKFQGTKTKSTVSRGSLRNNEPVLPKGIQKTSKKKSKGSGRGRNWAFTDYELLDWDVISKNEKIRYVVIGTEICPKTAKVHYQGFIQGYKPERRSSLKKMIGCKKIHLEQCIKDAETNIAYCKKDMEFKEFGEPSLMGQRTDIQQAADMIDDGATLAEVAYVHKSIAIKYPGGLKFYKAMHDETNAPTADERAAHFWVGLITGDTGTNKTRRAMEDREHGVPYKIQGANLEWWDGYNGEKTIVIDEYNNDVSITRMLELLDVYKTRIAVKGSFTWAKWIKIWITTNLKIDEIHPNAKPAHRRALFRRITEVFDEWDKKLAPVFQPVKDWASLLPETGTIPERPVAEWRTFSELNKDKMNNA